jgi:glycosyltransferase involved in cell wall biosynthesis
MSDAAEPIALSIVIPIRDERENLEPLVGELIDALGARLRPIEILLVDDGSRDGSTERIDELAGAHAEVRGLHLRGRCGQTAALDAGFKAACGRHVVTMDGDLQFDPRDVPRLVEALRTHDAVAGYRARRRDPWAKRLASHVANRVRNRLTGDDIIDTGCSLKAFRRECLASLELHDGMHRFLPTLLRLKGYRVVQLPVNHRPRGAGRSKYGIADRLFRPLADLLAVRWMRKRRLDYEIDPRR